MADTDEKIIHRDTAREDYFYWLGMYEEAKQESVNDARVRQLWTVVQNAKAQLD